ncbi:MAG TPA: class I SAM-dependent methyltransferase [Azospirillaceae bacterium]|nr:class I SAM-dependent methyltransferase [Azospirillaceae bacterium]
MSDRNDGYVTDVEYIPGLYPFQMPAFLDFVCILNGIAPPSDAVEDGGFAWCELGCGQGLMVNLTAASNPGAAVHGVDFHPGHIAQARAGAAAAGLPNAVFHEVAFEDIADADGLPMFDYVTLHGVYSWVGAETKRAIVRFLERRLKPGGAVLVSYNTVPGWARLAPLQRLLRAHADAAEGRSDVRVRRALDFARLLQEAGAPALDGVDLAGLAHPLPGRSQAQHDAYLAHEYLDADWQPLLHADVARDLAAAGLGYAGSAIPFQNDKELVLTPAQRAALDGIGDPVLRESMADYCGQPMLRKDVFVRAARRLTPEETDARLRAVPLAWMARAHALPYTIEGMSRSIVLDEARYGPVMAALAAGMRTVGDLADLPELRGRADAPGPRELALALVGGDFALPAARIRWGDGALAAARRFNRLQAAEAAEGRTLVAAMAAACGVGIAVDQAGAAVHLALADGVEPALHPVLSHVQRRLGSVRLGAGIDPAALQAEAARLMEMGRGAEAALHILLPLWRQLGAF